MVKRHGRGRYPHSFKRQVVAETFVEGASVAVVARRHGLNSNMVFGWRKDARFISTEQAAVFLPIGVEAKGPPALAGSDLFHPDVELANRHKLIFKDGIAQDQF